MDITTKAVSAVKDLAAAENKSDWPIRLSVVGGGCSGFMYDMEFDDTKQPTDVVFQKENIEFLIDPMSMQFLEDVTIDYIKSFQYAGFKFENPHVKQTCGCGSSFNV